MSGAQSHLRYVFLLHCNLNFLKGSEYDALLYSNYSLLDDLEPLSERLLPVVYHFMKKFVALQGENIVFLLTRKEIQGLSEWL